MKGVLCMKIDTVHSESEQKAFALMAGVLSVLVAELHPDDEEQAQQHLDQFLGTDAYAKACLKLRTTFHDAEKAEAAKKKALEQVKEMRKDMSSSYKGLLGVNVMLCEATEEVLKVADSQKKKLPKELKEPLKNVSTAYERARKHAEAAGDVYTEVVEDIHNSQEYISSIKGRLKAARKVRDNSMKGKSQEDIENAEEIINARTAVKDIEDELARAQAKFRKDYTNSGIPSSFFPNHPKLKNTTRKPSGKKPGGQKNHKGHCRKKLEPTEIVEVEVPKEFKDTNHYRKVENDFRSRQVQDIVILPVVYEYRAQGYFNLETEEVEYPKFPPGINNDVNFAGRLKAFLFLLVNQCNVSIGGAHNFLLGVSGGKFDVSTGCICNLTKQFAEKTEEERNEIFKAIEGAEVAHADFTFTRTAGGLGTILITATPDGRVLFQARKKKGLSAIKESPLVLFDGILVSDHESTFVLHCGRLHQECLQHVLRDLKDIIGNESMLTWPKKMRRWIKQAIQYRNGVLKEEVTPTREKAAAFLKAYDRIMELAKKEYGQYALGRPKANYRIGVNLFKRLSSSSDDYRRFLTDLRVPPTNNTAERYARIIKRKGHQVMCFRSPGGLDHYCEAQSVIQDIIRQSEDLFSTVAEIFDRPAPRKVRNKGTEAAANQGDSGEAGTSEAVANQGNPGEAGASEAAANQVDPQDARPSEAVDSPESTPIQEAS